MNSTTMTRTEDLTRTGWCKVHRGEFKPGGHVDRERLLSVGICSDCDFAMDLWRMRDRVDVARIKGEHYIIGTGIGERQNRALGMSGAEATIKFKDGRIVKTNDLWHQGKIPAVVAHLLEDNAAFVRKIQVQYVQ